MYCLVFHRFSYISSGPSRSKSMLHYAQDVLIEVINNLIVDYSLQKCATNTENFVGSIFRLGEIASGFGFKFLTLTNNSERQNYKHRIKTDVDLL